MARKDAIITISAEGRDKGKVFKIVEMPAMAAEKWATKALIALAKSGIDIPADISTQGLAGIATLGFGALRGISFTDAEPLLDEMLKCVSVMPDPAKPTLLRSMVENDIEEIGTILKLRMEVFDLHTGFFKAAVGLPSMAAKKS